MTRQSESVGALMGALARAQGSMRAAKKDRTNPHLGNKYATLDAVWDACREHLAANELALVQMFSTDKPGILTCDTMLGHSSGEWLSTSFEYPISTEQRGVSPVQQLGSLMTYIKRYTMSGVVGVTVDEDTDGNDDKAPTGGNGNGKGKTAPAPAPAQPAPSTTKCPSCGAPDGKPHSKTCKWSGGGTATATAPPPAETRTPGQAATEAHAPAASEDVEAQRKRALNLARQAMICAPGWTADAKDQAACAALASRIAGRKIDDVRTLSAEEIGQISNELHAREAGRRHFYAVAGSPTNDAEDRTRLSSLLGRNIESRKELTSAEWRRAADVMEGQAPVAEPMPTEAPLEPDPFAD